MSLNLAIEDNSFQNGVGGEKCRNCPPLPLLCSLMLNLVEVFSIDCYPLFFGSGVSKFSELPFLSPNLLFGWIVSESFSAFPENHVIVPL